MTPDPTSFIRENLEIRAVPGLSGISLHLAHPASRLHRIAGDVTPYWAYVWPGGAALARHFAAQPDSVRGRSVLDLGAGSGLVGIAAAKAGASRVIFSEIDRVGRAAISLNAQINGVETEMMGDMTGGDIPPVQIIAAGDVFYDPGVARKMLPFLRRAAETGLDVLVGDIGRDFLPRDALTPVASYPVREFGDGPGAPERQAVVYRLR